MNRSVISLLFLCLSLTFFKNSSAQNTADYNKGDFYTYWGWNWSWYSKSDIHFKGDNYDFTIFNHLKLMFEFVADELNLNKNLN